MVVGSVAFDTVITPYGRVDDALGGAATYFAVAASYFCPVQVVAVVGDDFGAEHESVLSERGVDTRGIERAAGPTFRWGGEYSWNLNERQTLFTELNVFESFAPQLPTQYRATPYVFLANIAPQLQQSVLEQVESPKLVALDTMNYWIEGSLEELKATLRHVDILIINDEEARELAGAYNLVEAAETIRQLGPDNVIIKRGEHGATAFLTGNVFTVPGLPLRQLADPTGAGDTFAGGFMGHLASTGDHTTEGLRRAIVAGSVLASFCVESFSLDGIRGLCVDEIAARYRDFQTLTRFDDI
ncbi:MAG TPA: PfkB family carbohydrate kinase [Acidobacteriota bacterium]|nr:PfkB family carbohydrate kinase [Acidobacteriota bacterium]